MNEEKLTGRKISCDGHSLRLSPGVLASHCASIQRHHTVYEHTKPGPARKLVERPQAQVELVLGQWLEADDEGFNKRSSA